ncbi:hypothetical protein [Dactylosporangium sp. NPDC048998]|uniref:hypothetical protein n=1 Tax=Dactylosporangium sp. NPDC048998 TaxID=3363976 RepID=UPI00371A95DF
MRVPIRRRALLAAAVVATTGSVAGCNPLGGKQQPQWSPAPDVLLPLLTRTVALRDRYAEVLTAFPALQDRIGPLKDDHAQHVIALAREIGLPEAGPFPAASGSAGAGAEPSATSTAVPTEQSAALSDLAALEKAGRQEAEAACLAAPSYRAALLGSIAACRAGHQEVLA